jgi:iron-sulfur cluster assembly accessory protein
VQARYTFSSLLSLSTCLFPGHLKVANDAHSQQLSEIIKATNNPSFALRIRVQSGGCHGFQYVTTNETLPPDLSSVADEDCVFRYVEDGGEAPSGQTYEGPRVIMDEASLLSLQGSKVDFVQELIGSKFEVMDNPGAANSCGCGSSFSLKL